MIAVSDPTLNLKQIWIYPMYVAQEIENSSTLEKVYSLWQHFKIHPNMV